MSVGIVRLGPAILVRWKVTRKNVRVRQWNGAGAEDGSAPFGPLFANRALTSNTLGFAHDHRLPFTHLEIFNSSSLKEILYRLRFLIAEI